MPFRNSRTRSLTGAGARRGNSKGLPKCHTIKAVAEALDVSPRTVRRWIKSGDLIAHSIVGVIRIAEGDLWAFLASHRDG
jgi:excisionase family DNA binding protein